MAAQDSNLFAHIIFINKDSTYMVLFVSQLFPAAFQVPGAVQFWYTLQMAIAMSMGMMGLFYPNTPATTLGGYWEYIGEDPTASKSTASEKKVVLAPNVRGWGLRNAIPGLVNLMAFYFGTKDTYLIMVACSLWREVFDIVEGFLEGDTDKLFYPIKVKEGKFPPLESYPPYFLLLAGNVACLYAVLTAEE
jgi:hypothetical protein